MGKTQIATQRFCQILDTKGRMCGRVLDHDNPEVWTEGRCSAHCRAAQMDGRVCSIPPMTNGLCYIHGGKPDQSIEKYMQAGITAQSRAAQLDTDDKEIYTLAMADPELQGHRSDLAVIEVRLHQLLGEQDQWKSETLLRQLREEIKRSSSALKKSWRKGHRALTRHKPDVAQAITALEDMEEYVDLAELRMLIAHGASSYSTWKEIDSLLHRRNQIATSERKRILDTKKFVSGDEALNIIEQILGALQKEVFNSVDENTAKDLMRAVSLRVKNIVGYDDED